MRTASASRLRRYRSVLLAFAVLLAASAALGEAPEWGGRVVDADGQPVASATVRLVTPTHETIEETRTDEAGRFRMRSAILGSAGRVEIDCPGYRSSILDAADLSAGNGRIVLETIGLRERVAVTALRQERELFETPQSLSVVTRADMDAEVVQTVPGALEGIAGVQVQRTDLGGGAPYVRGLIGNQVLLLVDGIPLNNSTYRLGPIQYLNTLDPFAVRRIEVLRGPASSLYGSGSLGGAINVLTQDADGGPRIDATAEYDTATQGPSAAVRGSETFGRLALTGGVSAADFDDLEGARGEQSPTGYARRAGDVKLSYALTEASALSVLGQFYEADDIPRYDRIAAGRDRYHFFDPQRLGLGYVQYRRGGEGAGVPAITATLSRVEQTEGRRILAVGSAVESVERDRVVTDGLGVQLTWSEWRRQTWTVGVDGYRDDVASTRVQHDLGTDEETPQVRGRFPDGSRYRTMAVYAQNAVRANARLDFVLGARYSRFRADAVLRAPAEVDGQPTVVESDYDADFGETTGSAYFLCRLTRRLHLSGGVAQGFRAPGLDDATIFGEFNAGWEVPNEDLLPERLTSHELSLKINSPRAWASITVFDTRLEDLISRAPGSFENSPTYLGENVFQRQNSGRAEIAGAELELRFWLLERLRVALAAATTRGTNVTNDTPLQRMPPFSGRIEAMWRLPQPAWWLRVASDFAGEQDRLSPEDLLDSRIPSGGTPGYGVTSIGAGFANPGTWQTSMVLYNVFDKAHRVHGSGLDGPGRSVRVLFRRGFSWDPS